MWCRPPGKPHVWRLIELIDRSGKKRKFSIQEVPDDRYEEALDFFCTVFVKDEAMCASLDLLNDSESIAVFRKLWDLVLHQGISVAAYEILENNNKAILAALNMLVYVDAETDKVLGSLETGVKAHKILDFILESSHDVDPRKVYNCNRYLTAMGLNTHPSYRRLGLGQQLLEIRDDIGKTYDIPYTSTAFTGIGSQRVAKKAGFEVVRERPYEEAIEEDGSLVFESLQGCLLKIMEKKINN